MDLLQLMEVGRIQSLMVGPLTELGMLFAGPTEANNGTIPNPWRHLEIGGEV